MIKLIFQMTLTLLFSFGTSKLIKAQKAVDDKAIQVIDEAIKAHGGVLFDKANYSFVFRNKQYTFQNNMDEFYYKMESSKDGKQILDILSNEGFSRSINGNKTRLSAKDARIYSSALNSVIYFATLPHKLRDPAVNKSYQGDILINDQLYHIVKITFDEEGGGEDYDDTFFYWINQENKQIDFLAYSYHVNGGGVRFRSAYNKRTVDGVLFQDYVNYKADITTKLSDLPGLWISGKLKELSKIETENVINLKSQ